MSVPSHAMIDTLCHITQPDASAEEIRILLQRALASGVETVGVPSHAVRRTVKLPPELVDQLREVGARASPALSVGKAVGALLHALQLKEEQHITAHSLWPSNHTRLEQRQVLEAAVPQLTKGRIVICEAGTGVGKSRIALYAAVAVLQSALSETLTTEKLAEVDHLGNMGKRGRIVAMGEERARLSAEKRKEQNNVVAIVSPTVANVNHLAAELQIARKHSPELARTPTSFLLGRRQFVSAMKLHLIALAMQSEDINKDERDAIAKLIAWITKGMPSGQCKNTKALSAIMPSLHGLAEDARSIAPELPIDEALLSDDDLDDDQEPYLSAKAEAQNVSLVITTHAMLAADNRALVVGTSAVMPNTLSLIIDEAHIFEQAQSNACSSGCSLFSLRALLRELPNADKAVIACTDAMDALKKIPGDIDLPIWRNADPIATRNWIAAQPYLQKVVDTLDARLARAEKGSKAKKKNDVSTFSPERLEKIIRSQKRVIETLLEGEFNGNISFSTIRRLPTLSAGPSNVANFLAARWEVTHSALLMSGTLLIPTSQGQSPSMILNHLAIPPDRAVVTIPVHPPWLLSIPTVYLPKPERFHEFVPPNREAITKENMEAWISNVGRELVNIAETAVGGVLVLMTGFERAAMLARVLEKRGLADRVIEQTRMGMPLANARQRFVDMSERDERPVWIGVGGAWTGIDLLDQRYKDDEASNDILLTDLVIPALPFGMVRTLTHRQRSNIIGFGAEKQMALLLFRQGIGRLIRRQNVLHRRLWIMDGRLQHPAMQNLTREFTALLSSYEKFKYF